MPPTFLSHITGHSCLCHSQCNHCCHAVTASQSPGDVHCVPAEGRLRAPCVVGPGPGPAPLLPPCVPTPASSHLTYIARHSSCPGPVHPLISNPRMSSHQPSPRPAVKFATLKLKRDQNISGYQHFRKQNIYSVDIQYSPLILKTQDILYFNNLTTHTRIIYRAGPIESFLEI